MKRLFLYTIITISLLSCVKDPVENANPSILGASDYTGNDVDLRVRDFIWKGLNAYYLWQADVQNLQDKRFGSLSDTKADKNRSYTEFLKSFQDPEHLFYVGLLNNYRRIDRFSYITDNYTDLENHFKGITANLGMNYTIGLVQKLGIYLAYVRYVVPNSDAERLGLQRGDVILSVNGQQLTRTNAQQLLQKTPIISFATYRFVNDKFEPTGKTYTLRQEQTPENPVLIHKVFNKGGKKIAYLMYNAFVADFDEALNNAFADFKAQGVTDLILDLRYNGGGSVSTATYLASMITGQFAGQVFAIVKDSRKIAINSLRMSKVYIITSENTASASELVINGLKPYIQVVQVGATTIGKNQGSVTIYDYIDAQGKVKNPKHKWAMQPLVMKIENAKGVGDYVNGLSPDIFIEEIGSNLGVLGDESEPLLARTLQEITGINTSGRAPLSTAKTSFSFEALCTSTSGYFGLNEMYK